LHLCAFDSEHLVSKTHLLCGKLPLPPTPSMPKRQKRSAQKGRSKSNSLPHMSPVSDGPPTSKTYNTLAGRPRNWLTSREQSITVTLELTPVTFLTTSTSAAVYTAYPFALNAAAAYAEYTSLFDQYRIDGIEAYVEPFLAAQGTTVFGDVALAVDLDDSSTPSSLNTVASKQGSIVCSGAAGIYQRWKPHVALAAYTGSFGGYANVASPWIDCGSPAVQHYGLKGYAGPTPAAAVTYVIYARMLCTFRAPGI
jgi:hypothetical protein